MSIEESVEVYVGMNHLCDHFDQYGIILEKQKFEDSSESKKALPDEKDLRRSKSKLLRKLWQISATRHIYNDDWTYDFIVLKSTLAGK